MNRSPSAVGGSSLVLVDCARRWARLLLPGILSLAAGTLFAATPPQFETLITQDADPNGALALTEFRSAGGVLNVQMAAAYAATDPNGVSMPSNPALGDPTQQFIYPRLAFYCKDSTHQVTSFAGPLLRARPGDRVHIQFINGLATQRTNLHFHGLNVSPHAELAGSFGDFVGLPYVSSTLPGNTRTYDFTIPANMLPGPFWYHAHAHGVAEMQVACGLSGALYIEGSVASYLSALKQRLTPLLTTGTATSRAAANQTLSQVESTLPQLPHHLLVLKDFWTPGLGPINGPLEQSVNGKVTYSQAGGGSPYVIQYGATDQIWEITNQSANMNYILTFTGADLNGAGFYVLAKDGMPTASGLSASPLDNALMIPPASRATVIVPTAAFNGGTVNVTARLVNTLGDLYFQVGNQVGQRPAPWNLITMTPAGGPAPLGVTPWSQLAPAIQADLLATAGAAVPFPPTHTVDATYVFAEGGGGGDASLAPANPLQYLPPEPTQFSLYRLADSHGTYVKGPSDAYDNYEPPIAQLYPGRPQHWIIQNTTGEWHDFHLHQVHFIVEGFTLIQDRVHPLNNLQPPRDNEGNPFYATNEPPPLGSGRSAGQPFYSGPVDTVSIPDGVQVWLTLPLTEGTQIDGQFVMHCHILEHEDGGMMANVLAGGPLPLPLPTLSQRTAPHLAPLEVASVKLPKPAPLKDSTGTDVTSDVFRQNDFSLVTFGYTTCQGACPMTLEKCVAALGKLKPDQAARISPFFVSVDQERDDAQKLRDYFKAHSLSPKWTALLDTNLATARAFGVQRSVLRRPDGSIYLRHSTTIYLIDRSMQIRAAFDQEESTDEMSQRLEKELRAPGFLLPATRHASS